MVNAVMIDKAIGIYLLRTWVGKRFKKIFVKLLTPGHLNCCLIWYKCLIGILFHMRSATIFLLGCIVFLMPTFAQTPKELFDLWDKENVTKRFPSNNRHRYLMQDLNELKALGVKVAEVGRSFQDREIFQIEWGKGPTKIFMWSQMHGDEPTATPALIDMFTVLQKNRDKDWVKLIEEKITIRAVPMLNPDGAEIYIRQNAQRLDINRDAVNLTSPEARLLKRLRDEWSPHIGFNLHNQQELTTAGRTNRQAAISFLTVYGDEAKTDTDGQLKNKRITAMMVDAIRPYLPGNIGRYGDEWTPSAFGDNFSAWGTPTILIETGALASQDEKYLVKMNFIAFITALNAVATGSEKTASPFSYEMLPHNSSGILYHFVFRGGTIVNRNETTAGDVAIAVARRRQEFTAPTYVRLTGDLKNVWGIEEFDASGYKIVGRYGDVKAGSFGELLFFKKDRQIDLTTLDPENLNEPDAVFSLGKFIKGGELFTKK